MVCLNLFSYIIWAVYSASINLMRQGKDPESFRVALPNYSDKEAAKVHFEETTQYKAQFAGTVGWLPQPFLSHY